MGQTSDQLNISHGFLDPLSGYPLKPSFLPLPLSCHCHVIFFCTILWSDVLLLDSGRVVSFSVANTLGQHTAGSCLLLSNDASGASCFLTVQCAMIPFPLVGRLFILKLMLVIDDMDDSACCRMEANGSSVPFCSFMDVTCGRRKVHY